MSSTLITVSYSKGIEDAWAKVATFVPKFVGFLVVAMGASVAIVSIGAFAALNQSRSLPPSSTACSMRCWRSW